MLIALAGQSSGPRAELLFRSAQQVNGEQRWSPVRKYSNPSDIAYPRFTSNDVPVPAEEVRVFLSGEITPADVASATVMVGLLESGKQKIAGNTVWLASNGGDIDAGMELARMLRDRGIYTLVGRNDQCLSACVFVFMGGERRSVAGRLGLSMRAYLLHKTKAPACAFLEAGLGRCEGKVMEASVSGGARRGSGARPGHPPIGDQSETISEPASPPA